MFNLFSWTHGIVLMEKKLSLKSLKEGLISPMFIATTGRGPFVLPSVEDSVCTAGFHELYCRHEHAPRHDGGRFFRSSGRSWKNVQKPEAVLYLRGQAADLPCLHDTTAHALPSADSDIHDDSDRSGMSVGHHRHDDGDPLHKHNYTYSSEIFSLTTVLGVVTMPALVLIAEQVL